MSGARVTAVVVTYRSQRTIGAALAALRRAHERGLLEAVVVDNQSEDDTLAVVRGEHPWVRVIASGANLGYARACNLGLAATRTPFVLFMNADATIEPEDVARLMAFLEARPGVGMVAPATAVGGGYQPAGDLISPATILAYAAGRPSRPPRRIVPGGPSFETDWLCGAVVMSRTDVLRALGGFDGRFFLYFEETDLCRRMRRRGLRLWAVADARAWHEGGASAAQVGARLYWGCIAEHYFRSRTYYLVKHWGPAVALLTEAAEVAVLALRWFHRRLKGRGVDDLLPRLRRPILRLPDVPA